MQDRMLAYHRLALTRDTSASLSYTFNSILNFSFLPFCRDGLPLNFGSNAFNSCEPDLITDTVNAPNGLQTAKKNDSR